MACGRALMNRQDGYSIGKALATLVGNVKEYIHTYSITTVYKEILLDFDDAEVSGFREALVQKLQTFSEGALCML